MGGRRSALRPHFRYELEDGGYIQLSAKEIVLKDRRFFFNTFASEEVDEKNSMCALLSHRYIYR
jgi:hypothetical protein